MRLQMTKGRRGREFLGRSAKNDGVARLAVNLPVAMHRQLKIRAAERGISIRDYIIALLRKDGIGR